MIPWIFDVHKAGVDSGVKFSSVSNFSSLMQQRWISLLLFITNTQYSD